MELYESTYWKYILKVQYESTYFGVFVVYCLNALMVGWSAPKIKHRSMLKASAIWIIFFYFCKAAVTWFPIHPLNKAQTLVPTTRYQHSVPLYSIQRQSKNEHPSSKGTQNWAIPTYSGADRKQRSSYITGLINDAPDTVALHTTLNRCGPSLRPFDSTSFKCTPF